MESAGRDDCHYLKGGSGERGCYQILESTYKAWALDILGYIPPRTYTNERYLVVKRVQGWLDQGYNEYQIALMYNGGEAREKKGVNRHGVAYDSGAYARMVLAKLN